MVEAQNRASTMRLTDSLDDQALLEEMIDAAKPPPSPACEHLHFLLKTPFRYAPYPSASRFRKAETYPGVFYGAESAFTAATELAFYRLLFFQEAPGMILPVLPVEHRMFAVDCATARAFDLTQPPFDAHAAVWAHITDHAGCHALAEQARALDVDVIRYRSVRDPQGHCLAILAPAAFAGTDPVALETWHVYVRPDRVQIWREFPPLQHEFETTAFAADPRIAARLEAAAPGA